MSEFGRKFPVVFPSHIIRDRHKYELHQNIRGYTHIFSLLVLPCRQEWLTSYYRECQNIVVGNDTDYWIYRVAIIHNGVELWTLGAGYGNDGSNAACFRMIRRLQEGFPDFPMPQNVIGFPNLRGHCFVISALLPLLHSFPFIQVLFNANLNFERGRNIGRFSADYHHRGPVECPFFWTSSFFEIYSRYRKWSSSGQLQLINSGFLEYLMAPQHLKASLPKPVKQPPYTDLQLDEALIHGAVRCFRSYCDIDYFASPGGDERRVLKFLFYKLSSEIPDFAEKCCFKVRLSYSCRFCSGGPYSGVFILPFLSVTLTDDFMQLFSNPLSMIRHQEIRCSHSVNGHTCNGEVNNVFSMEYLNVPQMFIISVKEFDDDSDSDEDSGDEVEVTSPDCNLASVSSQSSEATSTFFGSCADSLSSNVDMSSLSSDASGISSISTDSSSTSSDLPVVPDHMSISLRGQTYEYFRLASTVSFICYKTNTGASRGSRYHTPYPGDSPDGSHTFVHLLTQLGWFEINNGRVYLFDVDSFGLPTQLSLHFFQMDKFKFLPGLDRRCIQYSSEE